MEIKKEEDSWKEIKYNEIYKGGRFMTYSCPLCKKDIHLNYEDAIYISEEHYSGSLTNYTQYVFTCPGCKKEILTKLSRGMHAGFIRVPTREKVIKWVKDSKKSKAYKIYKDRKFRAFLKGELVYDDTGIAPEKFREAEEKGYAII